MRFVIALTALLFLRSIVGARCPDGATTQDFLAPGSYGVGVRTLPLVDETRPTAAHGAIPAELSRKLTTEVWYPTAPHAGSPLRDVPAAGGRFPLVLYSHGYSDNRTGEAYIAEALASRGIIVASPDFPLTNLATVTRVPADIVNQPGDVRFVLDRMLELAGTPSSWLEGRVDRHRIAASGLSYGGLTTLLVAFHPTLRDPRVHAAAALAPVACALGPLFYRAAKPPLLLVQGTQDLLVPIELNADRAYALSRSPRELIALENASHSAFTGLLTLPSAVSYDVPFGCPVVVREFGTDLGGAAALNDPASGIDVADCSIPCQGAPPTNTPMQAVRQHELTQAAVVAFFESRFRKSRAARCFLRQGLAQENSDVQVRSHPAGR